MARRKRGPEWVREDIDEEAEPLAVRRDRGAEKAAAKVREALALRIAAVPKGTRRRLPLSEHVAEAVEELVRQPPAPSRRRQLLVVKRLLADEDLEAIEAALSGRSEAHDRAQIVDRWRDRVVAEGDAVLEDFLEAHGGDRQRLRQLARHARKRGDAKAIRALRDALNAAVVASAATEES